MSKNMYIRKPIVLELLGKKKKDKEYLEVAFFLENKPSTIRRVNEVLETLNVKILEGFHDTIDGHGVWATFLEIDPATSYKEKLQSTLKIRGVRDIKYHKMEESEYFERFFFPLGTEDLRLLVIPQLAFVDMIKSILREYGSGGEALLYEEGVKLGEYLCETMKDICESMETPKEKVEFMGNLMRATGWGITYIKGLNPEEQEGFIEFKGNAEAKEGYPYQCHFTRGVWTKILRIITDNPQLELEETQCMANGKSSCRFSII